MEWKNKNARVYFPFKFNKAYVPADNNWLRWRVDEKKLSPQNHDALDFIRNHKVCFIHVRRGDYLFIINFSDKESSFTPDHEMRDLLTGKTISGEETLPVNGVMVLTDDGRF